MPPIACAASTTLDPMGSPAVAATIAHFAFWGLTTFGLVTGTLSARRAIAVLLLWVAGAAGLPYASYVPARAMFSSYVAVLDIALVFIIFKGDVRLT
jgi:hypothetical protein